MNHDIFTLELPVLFALAIVAYMLNSFESGSVFNFVFGRVDGVLVHDIKIVHIDTRTLTFENRWTLQIMIVLRCLVVHLIFLAETEITIFYLLHLRISLIDVRAWMLVHITQL